MLAVPGGGAWGGWAYNVGLVYGLVAVVPPPVTPAPPVPAPPVVAVPAVVVAVGPVY
jgi:hypothetical protein